MGRGANGIGSKTWTAENSSPFFSWKTPPEDVNAMAGPQAKLPAACFFVRLIDGIIVSVHIFQQVEKVFGLKVLLLETFHLRFLALQLQVLLIILLLG